MLNEIYTAKVGITKVVIVVGYTDLRSGIDRLAGLLQLKYGMNPYERETLYLFCGRRTDRIKGLVWEGSGFLLLYKRLEGGSFTWPRTEAEAVSITKGQYKLLMHGYDPLRQKVREIETPETVL